MTIQGTVSRRELLDEERREQGLLGSKICDIEKRGEGLETFNQAVLIDKLKRHWIALFIKINLDLFNARALNHAINQSTSFNERFQAHMANPTAFAGEFPTESSIGLSGLWLQLIAPLLPKELRVGFRHFPVFNSN